MTITQASVEAAAPDQASLKAAAKLMKPAKWPLLAEETAGALMWAECQGSGANPYRVCVDKRDLGYKCTCPSRKFPCKHALALMWFRADNAALFSPGTPPDWVNDWLGRRRKPAGTAVPGKDTGPKNIGMARTADAPAKADPKRDPKSEARKAAAKEKRAKARQASMMAATEDLDQWIADQLRAGLSSLLDSPTERCRKIAARLVDAKAASLAGRLDELPSRLLSYPAEIRAEILLTELGKLVLLGQAFRADPGDADLKRLIGAAETRQEVLDAPEALRVASVWESVGEQVVTRRDGLVAQSSWFLNLGDGPQRFAVLLDFFPVSAGKRGGSASVGERFEAEFAFYPSASPLRAVIAERGPALEDGRDWPVAAPSPLAQWRERLHLAPWALHAPLLLPAGRICEDAGGRQWWRGAEAALPLSAPVGAVALGLDTRASVGIWDGCGLSLLGARSDWGAMSFAA